MHNVYKNIDECNPDIKNKLFKFFDNIIADMNSNKRYYTELSTWFYYET